MTYLQKLYTLAPSLVGKGFVGGAQGCPHHFFPDADYRCEDLCCGECWKRQYRNEKPDYEHIQYCTGEIK